MMEQRVDDGLSPYRVYTRQEWAALRDDMPMTLTPDEVGRLRSLHDRLDMKEVEDIYLPLSRLLSMYVAATQRLHRAQQRFLGTEDAKMPYVIGVAGSVAVGKSTTARVLQALLARWPNVPQVELITTDGFLLPNAVLEREGLMEKKGFPESYDLPALLRFLSDVKAGRRPVRAPIYSHLVYDVIPNQWIEIDRPDILIVEGLNVLQTGRLPRDGKAIPFVSDFFDFSVYLDADDEVLKNWYVDRFLTLRGTAFRDPKSYFHRYSNLSDDEAVITATSIWERINLVNLHENILPTRPRADLILKKAENHMVDEVALRKLERSLARRQAAIDERFASDASMAASRSRPSGFTRKSIMPAARQASRSSAKALAVSATIGVAPASASSARMRRAASSPLRPGMCRSISTRSNGVPASRAARQASSAAWPSPTTDGRWPSRVSRARVSNALISLSSATRTERLLRALAVSAAG
jgi:type I pantothenate kinase